MSSNSNFKNNKCWSCEFFSGKRDFKTGLLGASVQTDTKGVCSYKRSSYFNKPIYETGYCSCYQKWGVLQSYLANKRNEEELKKAQNAIKKQQEENDRARRIAEREAERQQEAAEEERLSEEFLKENSSKLPANYEQKNERVSRFEYKDKMFMLNYFGWEVEKEFTYKNNDSRLTLRRDKSNKCYKYWQEYELLWEVINNLSYALFKLKETVKDIDVTFKEIASQDKYKLTGIKGFLGIRSSEQRKQIQNEVDEINKGYASFRKELEDNKKYIASLINDYGFFKMAESNSCKPHPCSERVNNIINRYKIIQEPTGNLRMKISGIRYDFDTKEVELESEE